MIAQEKMQQEIVAAIKSKMQEKSVSNYCFMFQDDAGNAEVITNAPNYKALVKWISNVLSVGPNESEKIDPTLPN